MALVNLEAEVMKENEEIFSKELGQRIARYRKEKGLTQQQLANAIGIKQYAVANYEIGRYRMPVALLRELARVLCVPADDLIGTARSRAKPGPTPRLQQQIEQLQNLPKPKQKFVSEFLDTILLQAHA